MARGSSKRGQRDAFDPSLAELLAPPDPLPRLTPVTTFHDFGFGQLSDFEDNRRWSPFKFSDAVSVGGNPAPTRRLPPSRWSPPPAIGFDDPRTAIRCVRRKQRREVIFAKNKRRKGAGARRRRRDFFSNVRC